MRQVTKFSKNQKLRIRENDFLFQQTPNTIVDIKSVGGRIIVGDIQESIHFFRYRGAVSLI